MQWIKVEDRLPEFNKPVLINWLYDPDREDGKTFNFCYVTHLESKITDSLGTIPKFEWVDNVTHWMELPNEPYHNI